MVENIKNNKGKGNDMDAIYNRKEQIKKGIFFVELDKSWKWARMKRSPPNGLP